jgi:hypothetical protein
MWGAERAKKSCWGICIHNYDPNMIQQLKENRLKPDNFARLKQGRSLPQQFKTSERKQNGVNPHQLTAEDAPSHKSLQ